LDLNGFIYAFFLIGYSKNALILICHLILFCFSKLFAVCFGLFFKIGLSIMTTENVKVVQITKIDEPGISWSVNFGFFELFNPLSWTTC